MAVYPGARCNLNHRSPFEPLVAVVLSVQTTDARVNQVTPELFAHYPDVEHPAGTGQDDVEEIINSLELYRSRVRPPIRLAHALTIGHDGRVPDSLNELVKLPGMGHKTTSVVLGDAFGIPGIAPDIHVIRVSNRLGRMHPTKPDDVERAIGALLPPGEWMVLCHWITWHDRRCCRARIPAHTACPVGDLCFGSQV